MIANLKHGFICLLTSLFFAALMFPLNAWADETQTLTGALEGQVTIPSSVTTLVLSGVQAGEDSTLTCSGDVTIEIADGTENHLNAVEVVGNLDVTGGGNLTATTILNTGAYISMNHTGTINFGQGMLCSLYGNIIINSGIIQTEFSDTYDYGILASEGSITVNGGLLELEGTVCAMYAGTGIAFNGGTIQLASEATAVALAGLGGESAAITIADTMDMGGLKAGYYTSEDGEDSITMLTNDAEETLTKASFSGPSVTDSTDYEALISAAADEESGEDATATSEASEQNGSTTTLSGKTILIAVLLLVALATVIAAFAITKKNLRQKN